jgi:predicted regulator of Ras-like GTPase activity (Roadblock/LC7/MglB family)
MAGTYSIRQKQGRGVALSEMLTSLVRASADFEGAVLVSEDGLVMAAAWPHGEQDDSDVGAVATRAFELSGRATESLRRGDLQRLILLGSAGNVVITRAGPHALCVVLLKPEAKIGIASFEAGRISNQIAEVLV